MRLKLDLHPIYNDSRAIEESLARIIDDAIDKKAPALVSGRNQHAGQRDKT